MAQVVDFYLSDAHAKERAEVIRLAGANDDAGLLGYVREAQRTSGLFASAEIEAEHMSSDNAGLAPQVNLYNPMTVPFGFPDFVFAHAIVCSRSSGGNRREAPQADVCSRP